MDQILSKHASWRCSHCKGSVPDNTPLLVLIHKIYPGPDGLVRVVDVRCRGKKANSLPRRMFRRYKSEELKTKVVSFAFLHVIVTSDLPQVSPSTFLCPRAVDLEHIDLSFL